MLYFWLSLCLGRNRHHRRLRMRLRYRCRQYFVQLRVRQLRGRHLYLQQHLFFQRLQPMQLLLQQMQQLQ